MSEDDRGTDPEPDAGEETEDEDPGEEQRKDAERIARGQDTIGREAEGDRQAAARERDAVDGANPDAHRDEEPFQSE